MNIKKKCILISKQVSARLYLKHIQICLDHKTTPKTPDEWSKLSLSSKLIWGGEDGK